VYVPQLGDAVVYLWEAHREFLDSIASTQDIRPWECFQQLGLAAVLQQQQQQQQQQPGQQEQGQGQQQGQQQARESQHQQGQEQPQQKQPPQEQLQQEQLQQTCVEMQEQKLQEEMQQQEQEQDHQEQQEQQEQQQQQEREHAQEQQQQQNGLSQPFQLRHAEPYIVVGLEYVLLPGERLLAFLGFEGLMVGTHIGWAVAVSHTSSTVTLLPQVPTVCIKCRSFALQGQLLQSLHGDLQECEESTILSLHFKSHATPAYIADLIGSCHCVLQMTTQQPA
jgi:hypothetical protein